MTIKFNPFDYENDQHYTDMMGILRVVWPDEPWDEASFRFHDNARLKSKEKRYYHRWLGYEDNKPVVSCSVFETWWNAVPDEYYVGCAVHPDHRNQGHATAFSTLAQETLIADGKTVNQFRSDAHDDQSAAIRFLENRGFTLKDRYPRSELKFADVDWSLLPTYQARMETAGLTIQPLSEIMPIDPDYKHKLWELLWVFMQDEPTDDPPQKRPFDEFVTRTLENPDFTPETWFLAVDKDLNYAGLTQLWKEKEAPDLLQTGWTGVDRPFRKLGVATAIKLHAAHWAHTNGYVRTRTDNHETNHMYQINLKIGFKPIPAELAYVKKM